MAIFNSYVSLPESICLEQNQPGRNGGLVSQHAEDHFFIAIVKLYVNDDDKPWKFGVTYFETNPFGEFVANLHGNILVLKSVKGSIWQQRSSDLQV